MNLASTFVVLNPDHSAAAVKVTPKVYEELDRRFEGFKDRLLVSCYSFDADWPSWERHPAGDEIVVLLSGRATFLFENKQDPLELRQAGDFAVVPRGVWHTAKTSVPTAMLFITPGESTEHRAIA
jgi:quercetin dioxygenase-like cupin family protein